MTEPTPLYDQLAAGDPAPAPSPTVDAPVDSTPVGGTAATTDPVPLDPAAPTSLDLPAGPNLDDLQAFTDAIPDEGHRAIAQHLVDAFTVRDQQLVAFIGAYTTAEASIAALQAALTAETERATAAEQALTAAVAALQPTPAPAPTTTTDPAPTTT